MLRDPNLLEKHHNLGLSKSFTISRADVLLSAPRTSHLALEIARKKTIHCPRSSVPAKTSLIQNGTNGQRKAAHGPARQT
jgi:hypothetical protein